MKLLRMTATFGRLDHETLTLTDGLNLLQLPNEAGKSTWAEFLLAMFYGIDTSDREKTGVLPVNDQIPALGTAKRWRARSSSSRTAAASP